MNLYVWEDVLTDYTSGVMFALAHSADEARDVIWKSSEQNEEVLEKYKTWRYFHESDNDYKCTVTRDLAGEPDVYPCDGVPTAFYCYGGG